MLYTLCEKTVGKLAVERNCPPSCGAFVSLMLNITASRSRFARTGSRKALVKRSGHEVMPLFEKNEKSLEDEQLLNQLLDI